MTDSAVQHADETGSGKGIRTLILSVFLALLAGGGAFYATWSGLIPSPLQQAPPRLAALPDIDFVALDPLVISLANGGQTRHLRFTAQIEVERPYKSEVEHLKPRILDLLNGYLRALTPSELEAPAALVRLRAQMLRRLQIITGEGRVRDLLITEFVIN
ncbi:flagellar FliL protein [Gemmobacter megaterium]|uniref:Flagellar protein FliL n=1 Tax=Gemmobacter megaterium TaxID=1086013 RepID=A0A1N7LVX2_9RHOB|nr:flagellar basal body-associated FliL family protein [Gemmobacter megaterium]GGE10357.1 flagellar basal body protein FliL [Gemmobacter megaterium]SIS77952.1 flagellar FliL protein [Gemmobacter megaterium]